MSLKCLLTIGAPASGKSHWAKQEVAKDPDNWVRINNDDIRSMTNGSVFSSDYEKLITNTRVFLIKEALKRDKNIILDNVNANNRHFQSACNIAKEINRDIEVIEVPFYQDLEVLLERDSKREGKAKVGEVVIKKWFKGLGGKQFKNYVPKHETFSKRTSASDRSVTAMVQDKTLPRAVICDLDGSLAIIGDRSPYDSSKCDITDTENEHVSEIVKMHYSAGYKIIFCSGRSEKDRAPTIRFIDKCMRYIPNMEYILLMRKDGDQRKDVVIKEEIFNDSIKNKYYVKLVLDDRLQVCRLWHNLGLNLLRAGDPDADF